MRKGLQEKFARRWPGWFDLDGTPTTTWVAWGLECGDGWFEIVWRLCSDLEPLVTELEKETGERFEVLEVEEKLGTLRFHVSHHTDKIDERIEGAGREASRTCTVCGKAGRRRGVSGRIACDEHSVSAADSQKSLADGKLDSRAGQIGGAQHALLLDYGFTVVKVGKDTAVYQSQRQGCQVTLDATGHWYIKLEGQREFRGIGVVDLEAALSPDERTL